jgi:hypothetical protein
MSDMFPDTPTELAAQDAMIGDAPASAAVHPDVLAALSTAANDHEASLEDLTGVPAVGVTPEQDDLDVLKVLSGATEEEASAAGSYGYDKALAEGGKPFKWPKLGPHAKLTLKKVGCKAWKAISARARAAYGDDTGAIDPAKFEEILPGMLVKSVFAGMEGVIVEVGQPPLEDSQENRLLLLRMFDGLTMEIFNACNKPKNFRDNSEKVLGN